MKLSGFYKELGNEVELKTDYKDLLSYDKVFISKVFTDTPIDKSILQLQNVEYGGTGFFYDKSPNLPDEIEHHIPDYHLYDKWIDEQLFVGGGGERAIIKNILTIQSHISQEDVLENVHFV